VALARRAAGDAMPAETSIAFGTSLGCLTETVEFLDNLIAQDGANPAPRAFSASVHNAIASRVAIALGARGACRTFTHGEVSFVQACAAVLRDRPASALVGGLDETTPAVRQACPRLDGEGGAVLVCGAGHALATLRTAASARPQDPAPFLQECIAGVDAVLLDLRSRRKEILRAVAAPTIDLHSRVGTHPSACAAGAALAVALLAGEISPGSTGLATRPRALGVVISSARADLGVLVFTR
jgi:hypothetical protein